MLIFILQHVSPVLWFGDPDFLMTLPPIAIAGNGPSREEDPTTVFQRATSRCIQNAQKI